MINLPKITDLKVSGKKVLLRLDLDTDPDPNDLRIKSSEATLNYLKEKNAQITILAHRGRPGGKFDESLSLKSFQKIFDKWGARVEENLRFEEGEESNDLEFTRRLAVLGDVFVNEAFGNSHREHASIVGIPKILPHAAGFRFAKEVENLSKVFDPSTGSGPRRPVVFIIGGVKKDKLDYLDDLGGIADKILVGGRLPAYAEISNKILVANLLPDKEDITINSVIKFEEEIQKAGTVILAGPMGKYEEDGHRQGTARIFKAVAASCAFKVAGGGDTEKAIKLLVISDKFDWISVGGGAMLEFLAKKTLPGIKALESVNLNIEGL